jgi:hypothetical protein
MQLLFLFDWDTRVEKTLMQLLFSFDQAMKVKKIHM